MLHEESALHDLHDDDSDLHSQSAVHGLQTSAVHSHGDAHSLCASPSSGQAKLLRAASRLPSSAIHRLHSGLPAANLPDLHGGTTRSKLRHEVIMARSDPIDRVGLDPMNGLTTSEGAQSDYLPDAASGITPGLNGFAPLGKCFLASS